MCNILFTGPVAVCVIGMFPDALCLMLTVHQCDSRRHKSSVVPYRGEKFEQVTVCPECDGSAVRLSVSVLNVHYNPFLSCLVADPNNAVTQTE